MVNRRTLLASIGTAGTVAITGCSSGGNNNSDGGDVDNSDTNNADNGSSSGPADAIRQFIDAAKENDIEKGKRATYGTERDTFDENDFVDADNFELTNTKELTLAEVAESDYFGSGETEEDVETNIQGIKSETGADKVVYMETEFRQDGETQKTLLRVIRIDGDWKVILM